jgi:hypothetical protein
VQQKRAVGATWLDQRLIAGGKDLGERGFGAEVREALPQRSDFLIEQGLAERRGQRVILARNLLATAAQLQLSSIRGISWNGVEAYPEKLPREPAPRSQSAQGAPRGGRCRRSFATQ